MLAETTATSTPGMQTLAFRMDLHPGMEAEYKKRHDALWPELHQLLKDAGICDYHIYLDQESHALFALLHCPDNFDGKKLAQQAVMRRWWDYMADIMIVHESNEPRAIPLVPMFHMA